MKTKHYAGLEKQAKDAERRLKECQAASKRPSTKKNAEFAKALWYLKLTARKPRDKAQVLRAGQKSSNKIVAPVVQR